MVIFYENSTFLPLSSVNVTIQVMTHNLCADPRLSSILNVTFVCALFKIPSDVRFITWSSSLPTWPFIKLRHCAWTVHLHVLHSLTFLPRTRVIKLCFWRYGCVQIFFMLCIVCVCFQATRTEEGYKLSQLIKTGSWLIADPGDITMHHLKAFVPEASWPH